MITTPIFVKKAFRNNMDACNMAHNCPLGPGTNQTFQLKLDLSSFAAIINLLASDVRLQGFRFEKIKPILDSLSNKYPHV